MKDMFFHLKLLNVIMKHSFHILKILMMRKKKRRKRKKKRKKELKFSLRSYQLNIQCNLLFHQYQSQFLSLKILIHQNHHIHKSVQIGYSFFSEYMCILWELQLSSVFGCLKLNIFLLTILKLLFSSWRNALRKWSWAGNWNW